MQHVTYSDMAARHGDDKAFQFLECLERLAQIKNDIICLDRDLRFQRAFEALCEINFAG
ncbi:MAG: hypothetical protein KGI37_04845 [Alphaproteobacteria bacterium]|nr:hypothetical protein [Alphaproteobacteria bacterium]